MRVFLDTNVLVSAFATRGLSADVVRLVLTEHELVVTEPVLEELERVLRRKMRFEAAAVAEVLAFLRGHRVAVPETDPPAVVVRDPDDARVLASALAAGAEVLVTGDADLLDVRERVGGLTITNPRGFWEMQRRG